MRWEDAEVFEPTPVLTMKPNRKTRLSRRLRLRALFGVVALGMLCSLAAIGATSVIRALRPAANLRLVASPGTGAKATLASASVERKLGFVTVSGSVLSRNGQAMPRVEAVVELLDAQNRTVQVDAGMVAFDPLPAGEAAPFRVEVTDSPQAVAYRIRFRQLDGLCLN
jgi:uncharacterized iron-regulated membrane protein